MINEFIIIRFGSSDVPPTDPRVTAVIMEVATNRPSVTRLPGCVISMFQTNATEEELMTKFNALNIKYSLVNKTEVSGMPPATERTPGRRMNPNGPTTSSNTTPGGEGTRRGPVAANNPYAGLTVPQLKSKLRDALAMEAYEKAQKIQDDFRKGRS
jgi:hypothetical protein